MAEREFAHSLAILSQVSPDAHLRTILRKSPDDRTEEDISLIFDELIQIPALSELTASVKQELAHVISYEFHPKKGTVGKLYDSMNHVIFVIFSKGSNNRYIIHVT
jgi:Rap guanine nucleotide exchange factor 4